MAWRQQAAKNNGGVAYGWRNKAKIASKRHHGNGVA